MDTQLYAVVGLIGVNLILLIVLLWRSISKSSQEENLLIQKYLDEKLDRLERALRQEVTEASREARQELTQNLATFQQSQIQQLSLMQKSVSDTLHQQLQQLQKSNNEKLDEMRRTVDEKLQTTLEKRLSESFKQVAERLEQVHNGLGQMQKLAQGVGDLQRVLTNVKTRGIVDRKSTRLNSNHSSVSRMPSSA